VSVLRYKSEADLPKGVKVAGTLKRAQVANEFAPIKIEIVPKRSEVGLKAANKQSLFALGRLKQGVMNATERGYGAVLEARRAAGEVLWYKFEGLRFQLAPATAYTPDFAVMVADNTIELHEVKGYWQDDAKAKIKIASSMYPFRFVAVQKVAKKQGGGWKTVEY
jgi:hypothetical protein